MARWPSTSNASSASGCRGRLKESSRLARSSRMREGDGTSASSVRSRTIFQPAAGRSAFDLGLKTLAACSNGSCVPTLGNYRRYEASLARAQRARSKKRVQAIHTKIANARRHQLHEESTRIARENSVIVVGNVSPAKLAKTRMAKSVRDAGWSMLRNMLAYKARRRQACFIEVNERLTSATCSECLALSGPNPTFATGRQNRRFQSKKLSQINGPRPENECSEDLGPFRPSRFP